MAPKFLQKLPWFKRNRSNTTLLSPEDWLLEALLNGRKTSSGITVNAESALGVAAVFACVNLISRSIATLPLILYRKTDNGKERATDHPLYNLLHISPNDDMTASEFIVAMQGNLTLRNNAYAMISRNGLRQVKSIRPIDPADMQVKKENGGAIQYLVNKKPISANRIIHLRGLSTSGFIGLETYTYAREAIALAIALQDDVGKFFANGARVGSLLMTDASLTPDQVKEIRERFDEKYSGAGNQYKTAILTNGLKPFIERFNYNDAELTKIRDFQLREVARVFNVALHKIQINDNIPRANNEEQNRQFITDTLRPYIVQWEQRLTMQLLTEKERETYSIGFVMDALLRGNTKERYEAHRIGREAGWLSVNEIRAFEDMNSIGPEGDTYIEPMNHQPVGTGNENDNANETEE